MKYLLDTNICIYLFKGKYNLIEKIKDIGIENCAISEITYPSWRSFVTSA